MKKNQQPGLGLFVVGLLGLGVIGVMVRDFALVWQPVPESLPGRHALALATGVLMILLGLGLAVGATRAWAVRILLPYLVLWAALKIPAVIAAPNMEAVYLGLGELTLLLSGGWTLFANFAELAPGSALEFLAGERGMKMARILFALSIIPIGLSHIVYADVTAGYVPHYFPYRLGWAYLTGAGQMASGLGVLFGVLPRIAAWAEAGQIALYTLLVWGGAIVAAPKTRLAWTAFFISWIFGAAAWVVAQNVRAKNVGTLERLNVKHQKIGRSELQKERRNIRTLTSQDRNVGEPDSNFGKFGHTKLRRSRDAALKGGATKPRAADYLAADVCLASSSRNSCSFSATNFL